MRIRMLTYISVFLFVFLNIGQTCTLAVISGKLLMMEGLYSLRQGMSEMNIDRK